MLFLFLIFAFVAGWYITGFSVTDGLIFMGISVVNFLAMQLGRSKTSITLAVFAAIAAFLSWLPWEHPVWLPCGRLFQSVSLTP